MVEEDLCKACGIGAVRGAAVEDYDRFAVGVCGLDEPGFQGDAIRCGEGDVLDFDVELLQDALTVCRDIC